MKRITLLLVTSAFLISLLGCQQDNNNPKYAEGKDTIESSDNGRYQIMKGFDGTEDYISLVDYKPVIEEEIISKISSYKKVKELLLVKGDQKYVILDTEHNKVTKYTNLHSVPKEYQSIFKKMK
ncbi:hypothetical protein [Priestia koreensis]|uniref:hypothetical protein n=1 Tax=Priestia koreensis TaxID=284581 RepID=UPI001F57FA3C|nr:hypothetical protein [Priestia koreensis]UNL87545.1 hypothetical protein IE339_23870 [Priestia koreensis]